MTFEEFMEDRHISNISTDANALKGILQEAYTYGADWWILGSDSWRDEFYLHNAWNAPCHVVPDEWEDAQRVMSDAPDWPSMSGDGWFITKLVEALENSDDPFAEELRDKITDAKYAGAYEGWKDALRYQESRNSELTDDE